MIRVATTLKKLREGIEDVAPDGYNTEQQLDAMRARARRQHAERPGGVLERAARGCSRPSTSRSSNPTHWTPQIREFLSAYFAREICPVLTPLAFDPGHPFPLISNLSKNFAVVVRAREPHEVRAREGAGRAAAIHPAAGELSPSAQGRRSSSSRTSSTRTCRSSSPERR